MKKVLLLLCCWLTALGLSAASYPDKIYLIGSFCEWHTDKSVAPDTNNNGVYTWNEIELPAAGETDQKCYFRFVTYKSTTSSNDWEYGVNKHTQYGSNSNNLAIKTTDNPTVYEGDSNNWTITPGTYKLVLNLVDKKLTITEIGGGNEGGDEHEENPTTHTVYFDNSDTKWSTVKCYAYVTGATDQNAGWSGVEMEKVRDNIYSYTSTVAYKIVIFNNGSSQTENLTWEDNYIYNKDGKIQEYTEDYGRPVVNYSADFYIIGNVNDWAWNAPTKYDSAENGVYTWNELELKSAADNDTYSYFTFITTKGTSSSDFNTVNQADRYGASKYNETIPTTLTSTIVKYPVNVSASGAYSWKVAAGKYKVVADLSTMTLTLTKIDDIVIPPVNDRPDNLYLYMYNSNIAGSDPDLLLNTWSGKFENNVFTFTVKSSEIGVNNTLLLSTTEKYNDNTLYGPVDNTNISMTNAGSKFTNFVHGSTTKRFWTIDEAADYTITVDWDNKTLTATKVGGEIEDPDPIVPDDVHYVYYEGTFSSPQVHAWYKENGNDVQCTTAGGWPGDNMVKKDGKWYWELPAGKSLPTQIIIHQNGSKIGVGDLDYVDKATYHHDGTYFGGIVIPSAVKPSGKLPVLYINVYEYTTQINDKGKEEVVYTLDADDNKIYNNNIISKDIDHKNYFSGSEYWIETNGCDWMVGAENVGSADEPLPLEIKARGNFTRKGYSKKPFKLKLGSKQNLLGINRAGKTSKHWALLAHADDNFGYMRNFVGFRLGEMIGLPWTPNQQPIEVVINGDYRGIYFLTESIRVEKGRIEIESLDDEVSDPALISGGYLVELDNYADDAVVTLKDRSDSNRDLYITPDTPEVYSDAQKNFVEEQFTTMNNLVNSGTTWWDETTKDGLWSYMDLDDAARYYVVEEIISHYEAYHGSTYLFRDRYSEKKGNGKWHFSPLWDCGHAFDGSTNGYFTDNAPYGNSWIKGLRNKTQFMDKVKATFQWFINDGKINNGKIPYDQLCDEINAYADHIAEAAKQDRERWKNAPLPNKYWEDASEPTEVVDNTNMLEKRDKVKEFLDKKITWLKDQWGSGSAESAEPEKDQTLAADLPDYVLPGYVPTRELYVINDGGWSDVSIWVYNSGSDHLGNNKFPGVAMTYEPDLIVDGVRGVYHYTIPEEYTSARVIFSQADTKKRYPGDNDPGLEINKRNMVFHTEPDNNNYTFVEVTTVENFTPKPWSEKLPLVKISTLEKGATNPVIRHIGYGEDGRLTKCSFEIDACDTDFTAVTSDTSGKLTIKGRGKDWVDGATNHEHKNSFKLKLGNQISLLGMNPSAHWVLMPYTKDVDNAMLTNYAGHEMAKLIGMTWTPSMEPVEVVIDDEYMGLYFLAENVRAAEQRVPIADYGDKVANDKWKDYNKEHDFLLEIDADHDENDDSELFYSWANGDFTHKLITSTPSLEDINDDKTLKKNPELLAATIEEIRGHIDTHITEVQNAVRNAAANIYSEDWANVIDAKQAVKYYIVQEIMDDARSFTNNFYMYHTYEDASDGPAGTKWFFGPVWDFSGSLAQNGNKSHLIHEVEDYDGAFIKDLYKNRQFVFLTGATFHKFYTGELMSTSQVRRYANGVSRAASIQDNFDPEIDDNNTFEAALTSISDMAGRLQEAADKDAEVWSSNAATSTDSDVADRADALIQKLRSNASYLAANVSEGGAGWNTNDITTGVEDIIYGSEEYTEPVYFDLMGRRVAEPQAGNIYIVRRGATVTKEIIK